MVPKRTPLPRPQGPLDPRLEEAAARALESCRAKPVRKPNPPRAGQLAAKIVRPMVKGGASAGKSLGELRRQWADIVGEKDARVTEPDKLAGGKAGRVLTVKVAGSAAPFIQHKIPMLLERCNLAGADLKDIKLIQGVVARPAANVRPLRMPLSADEERLLESALAPIGSPRLKAALLRLGRGLGQKATRVR
jgi:hypothetical protein